MESLSNSERGLNGLTSGAPLKAEKRGTVSVSDLVGDSQKAFLKVIDIPRNRTVLGYPILELSDFGKSLNKVFSLSDKEIKALYKSIEIDDFSAANFFSKRGVLNQYEKVLLDDSNLDDAQKLIMITSHRLEFEGGLPIAGDSFNNVRNHAAVTLYDSWMRHAVAAFGGKKPTGYRPRSKFITVADKSDKMAKRIGMQISGDGIVYKQIDSDSDGYVAVMAGTGEESGIGDDRGQYGVRNDCHAVNSSPSFPEKISGGRFYVSAVLASLNKDCLLYTSPSPRD